MSDISQTSIDTLSNGLATALAGLQSEIAAQIYTQTLPLIGTSLEASAAQGQAALNAVTGFRTALSAALAGLSTAATHTASEVQAAMNAALAGAGFSGNPVSITVTADGVVLAFDDTRAGSFSTSVASDLGMPGLSLQTGGTVTVATTSALHLTIGVDADGFYVGTGPGDEVSLGLSVTGASLGASAFLGPLGFHAIDEGSSVTGSFSINIKDFNNDGHLRLNELNGDVMDAALTAAAAIKIGLGADFGTSALPAISADMLVNWNFAAATVDVNIAAQNFGGLPTVEFQNVRLDLGAFVNNFLQPFLDHVVPVLKPIQEALSILDADIPLLHSFQNWQNMFDANSDGKVTLIDLMAKALPGIDLGPLQSFIGMVDNVVSWSAFFENTTFTAQDYVIGNFTLANGADIRSLSFDLGHAPVQFGGLVDTLASVIGGLSGSGWGSTDSGSGMTGETILASMVSGGSFDLPILTDPNQAIKFLLGGDADLIQVHLPEVGLTASNSAIAGFPIFPGLNAVLGGSLSAVFDFAFGFDTRGLNEGGDMSAAINGLYLIDGPGPEVTLSASIALGVELDFLIASVYGGGDVTGTIHLDLADALQTVPGRLYYDQIAAALADNPFSVFDTSGRITAGFSAYATVLYGEIWRFTSPRITLGGFSFDGASSHAGSFVAALGSAAGGTLTLNIGAHASDRAIANHTDGAEEVQIASGVGGIGVQFEGYEQDFSGITLIAGDGGAADDQIVLSSTLNIAASLAGGAGNDVLAGGKAADTLAGGNDDDQLFGNAAADSLSGDAGNDVLTGGAGNDTLDGGGGYDTAMYDDSNASVTVNLATGIGLGGTAQGDHLAGIEAVVGSDYDDVLTGGDTGGPLLMGRTGNDTLNGGAGLDVLSGGTGDDVMDAGTGGAIMVGGTGNDIYYVHSLNDVVNENLFGEVPAGQDGGHDLVITSVNWTLNTLAQADIEDLRLTGAAHQGGGNALNNLLAGGGGGDSLLGAGGDDTLNGNNDDDMLSGEDGNDRLYGGVGNDLQFGGANDDTVDGGVGNDALSGDAGNDHLYGGVGDDTLDGGAGLDTLYGGADNDTFLVDAAGDQVIELVGGGTQDKVLASVNWVLMAAAQVEVLAVNPTLSDGRDLTGNALAQAIVGAAGNDTLEGLGGADSFSGGLGTDTVTYRSSHVAVLIDLTKSAQTGGDAEGDTYLGVEVVQATAFDDTLTGGILADHFQGLLGADSIFGAGAADTLEGGGGNDTLDGGAGADSMAGGAGNDIYYIDNIGDVLDEVASGSEGHDLAYARVNSVAILADGVEDLTLLGAARIAMGNSLNNVLTGTAFADRLDGYTGIDRMVGGGGGDTYVIDRLGDRAVELAGQGIDQIEFWGNFFPDGTANPGTAKFEMAVYAANVENLRIMDFGRPYIIVGNAQNNRIEGNTGSDTLYGGVGNDTLVSGHGSNEAFFGGAGNDLGSFGAVRPGDTFIGGAGDDTLQVDWSLSPYAIGMGATGIGTYLDGVGGVTLTFDASTEHFDLTGGFGADNLIGGAKADTLSGAGSNDTLHGGTGRGAYYGGDGMDVVLATISDDTGTITARSFALNLAAAEAGPVTVNGGTSVQTTWQGVEIVQIVTGAGNDSLSTQGVASNSSVTGFSNTFDAGDGNDTLATDALAAGHTIFHAGLGTDLLVVDWSASHYGVFYDGAGTYNTYVDGFGGSQISFDGVERFNLIGSDQADRLEGGALDDTLIGAGGNDTLTGFTGTGVYYGGDGQDVVIATISANGGALTSSDFVLDLKVTQTSEVVVNAGTAVETHWMGVEQIRLVTGSGNDRLSTQGVASSSVASNYSNMFDAGAGNDTLATDTTALGHTFFYGGAGTDLLVMDWTASAYGVADDGAGTYTNYVDGFGGNQVTVDSVERFNLTGGVAADNLRGGALDDTLIGAGGTDTLAGFTGTGVYDGGDGQDVVIATISANGGALTTRDFVLDLKATQTAEVVVNAGTEVETHWKGIEQVNLVTGSGNDRLSTRGVASSVVVSTYSNTFDAGAGNDTLSTDATALGHTIFHGGADTDLLIMDWTAALHGVSYDGAGTYSTYVDGFGGSQITFDNVERFNLTGSVEADDLRGGALDDTLIGGGGNDTLTGGTGRGVYKGGIGMDLVSAIISADGGAASTLAFVLDLAAAQKAAVNLNAGTAFATTWQGIEQVQLVLGSGNDRVSTQGVASNASVTGQSNSVDGGDGNDTFATDALAVGNTSFIGGAGIDTLQVDWSAAAHGVGFDGQHIFYNYVDGYGTNQISTQGVERFNLTGSAQADLLVGGGMFDTLAGAGGNDTLIGGTGRGIYLGGTGQDLVTATISTDAGVASKLDFVLRLAAAEAHSVTVNAGTAVATTWSGVEQVVLTLGSGNDLVNTQGVASNATDSGYSISVDGGSGNDTFASDALAIGQTVFTGGAGTDTLVMDWSVAGAAVGFDGISTYGFYVAGYGTSRITATSVDHWQLTGSDFDDMLQGGGLQDSLTGGDGADTLIGLAGIDILSGGAGNDGIDGGIGNDILIGGFGNDTLAGGQGADHFVFTAASAAADTIVDFNQVDGGLREGDVLEFRSLLVGAFSYRGVRAFTGGSDNTEARVVGDHLLIDINGDKSVDITLILTGLTSANQLAVGDFLFI